MEVMEIFKALSNPLRLDILRWLKTPGLYFPDQEEPFSTGVCAGQIQHKSGYSFSTVSEHLAVMQKAGILISVKKGQWIFYKRNEELIAGLAEYIAGEF